MGDRGKPRDAPRGWPAGVSLPGSQGWETMAAAWLGDLLPELSGYPAIRQNPVVLAFVARQVLAGAVDGARQGYRAARRELGDLVPPGAIGAVLGPAR